MPILKKNIWKSVIAMEPLVISFLLCSTYDLLPNATNLKLWRYTDSDLCFPYKSDRGTLRHVLSACPQSLQKYSWWHNKVLELVIELLRAQCEAANLQTITAKEPIIQFHKEGECPVRKLKKSNMKLLNGASDWKVSVDLKTSLQCPVHIIQAEKRLDIVAWFKCLPHWIDRPSLGKKTGKGHPSVRKTDMRMRADCMERGSICHVIPIEVSCRGYFFSSLSRFVSFKNRNHCWQFKSCLISSSVYVEICIKLNLIESKKSLPWMKCKRNHHSCVRNIKKWLL